MLYRIAHLSDLHFASWDWKFSQFFSKRWLGNFNFLLGRKPHFDYARLKTLPSLLKSLDVNLVVISGDLSTTSAPAEFLAAERFIASLEQQGLDVLCIPGNHDHYTQNAYKTRLFYDYFASSWDTALPFSLKNEGVTARQLCPGWWAVGLDTALACSWFYSTGHFQSKTEKALIELLSKLPASDHIMLINHFPFFQHESPRKHLIRGPALQQVIENHPQIKIYCHGHTHRQCQANLRSSNLPLILDPGSTPHRKQGGWYLMDLSSSGASVDFYKWGQSQWESSSKAAYELV